MTLQILDQSNIPTIKRPDPAICEKLKVIGSASIAAELGHMGVRQPHMQGIVTHKKGHRVCGPALTLQFMPKREDFHKEGEYQEPETQLHRHVMYQVEKGDIVVVDARGDMASGIFGEMMCTYMAGRGGAGVVIDGCIRDSERALALDLGFWLKGVTPNFHVQTFIMPWAVNVPVSCGGVLVMPGDLIVADDDGAVVIPIALVDRVLEGAGHHADWEEFTYMKLSQGGDLRKYYPLTPAAEEEYREWRKANPENVLIAVLSLALATPAGAQALGPCYARVYAEKHLKEHPDQKVAMITFGRSEYQAGGQIVNYDLHVQLRGQTEVYLGNAYCETSVEGYACGMEGDMGAVLLLPRAENNLLIVVHPAGVSFEGDSDVLQLSGRKGDDREFLLRHPPRPPNADKARRDGKDFRTWALTGTGLRKGRFRGMNSATFALHSKEAIPILKRFRRDIQCANEDVSTAGAFLARAVMKRISDPSAPPMQGLDTPHF